MSSDDRAVIDRLRATTHLRSDAPPDATIRPAHEAQTLAGGEHLRDRAILIIILISAGAGDFVGTVLGGSRSRPPRGS